MTFDDALRTTAREARVTGVHAREIPARERA
jgi:hypothetical protein